MSIVVTGATGALGRLVIDELLARVPAEQVAAVVRDKEKAAGLAARGVELRIADYDDPASLTGAFRSGDRVLLISGSEVGRRVPQHTAVIEAAKAAGVAQLAYTGVLGGPDADFQLAAEHKVTEQLILDSGLPHTFLRNGWYTENYTANLAPVLAHGAVVSNAGEGRVASAARADYAAAAAAVLVSDGHLGKVYELSGDVAWSYPEYAAEVAKASGQEIGYRNVPAAAHQEILVGAGLPEEFAAILVDVDSAIERGLLAATSGDLARLTGRPTTPIAVSIAAALA
ncbi:SDR family oxidoreductase [Streptomyces sp. NBC_01387]|uniref:SDR family oxidoreductase n=1 Tax=unclassified Streptomyces TaxID=2593676 RepID=UPI002025070F|nr:MULTISPECIES: SDR family oxidoreductase [unclassified Streptomyces]MCX4548946.1 SDR family oxidoreductase [Streptomyces sp. NBC_01500]WSC20523.1 SDR family oxidoreductase [Streptomyces sp. NBC_01766]WSV54556.1 SDR family oxidoreductase [Streptomyces sp. NBC_01014]